jgi:hypothetical protein
MPFELGLSVAMAQMQSRKHVWFVFESKPHRLAKSLSDLNGTDVHIHSGRIDGVFRALSNAFVRERRRPTVQQMRHIYRELRKNLPAILKSSAAASPFEARPFKDLCFLAGESARKHVI